LGGVTHQFCPEARANREQLIIETAVSRVQRTIL